MFHRYFLLVVRAGVHGFKSKPFAVFLRFAVSLLERVSPQAELWINQARNTVAFHLVDSEAWRFTTARSLLESRGFDTVILKEHSWSGNNSFRHKGHRKQIPEGTRVLSLCSVKDWIYLNNIGHFIFSNPYLTFGLPGSLHTMKNTEKIYVPYTYGVTESGAEYSFGKASIQASSFVSISNPNLEGKYSGRVDVAEKLWGFPELSKIRIASKNNLSSPLKILWAPHWTTGTTGKQGNGREWSKVLESIACLKETLEKREMNPEIRVRMHPRSLDSDNSQTLRDLLQNYKERGVISLSPKDSAPYEDFNWSSMLIHNSGSFLTEYLFSGKPCFFLTKNSEIVKDLNALGRESLQQHYLISKIEEISDEVSKVLFKDEKKEQRIRFRDTKLSTGFVFEEMLLSYLTHFEQEEKE